MRLTNVEAVRFGELSDEVLGVFGASLSVVYGRNEAGKSTYSSLIRQILYGFPRGRTNERQYLPPSGDARVGRLVFDDDGTPWIVERTEGAHGGRVMARGPHGEQSGDVLLEPLIAGVSAGVFKGVFGFSLEELSDFSALESIQSRLYATSAGLLVNPYDVLEKLRADADALWAPRARTKELHRLNQDLRSLREDRRKLEEAAESYRVDREQRVVVGANLQTAEGELQSRRREEARLRALLVEGHRLEDKIQEDEAELEGKKLDVERARREAAAHEVDDELLERSDTIERLGARFELFRSEASQLKIDLEKKRQLETDLERRVTDLGESWTLETAGALHLDLELENRLHESEERLRETQRRREEDARRASEARKEHDEAEHRARELSQNLGLENADQINDEVGTRLETVDRLLTLGHGPDTQGPSFLPAAAAAVVAVAIVVAGFFVDNRPLMWAAVPIALLAVGLAVGPLLYRRRIPRAVAELLPVLELEETPSAIELMEMKNRLEECRRLWATETELALTAAAREESARSAAENHDRAWRGWLAWVDEHQLHTLSDKPESVRRVLRLLRDLRSRMDSMRGLQAEVDRREELCQEYGREARTAGATLSKADGSVDLDGTEHGVRSLLARSGAARRSAEKRRELLSEASAAEEQGAVLSERITRNRRRLTEIFGQADLGDGKTMADLEAAAAVAGKRAGEIEAERDQLLEHRGTLDGRLQRGAEESASSELRLAESGLIERIADTVEAYAVKAVAARLLEESLEVYEAERQPAVIQRAQEIFSSLTDGRYTKIGTPLGSFEPTVSDGRSIGKAPQKLSRATAEQLFLALRLSYIENLSGAHPALPVLMDDVLVNFDDERRGAAAEVIAEFANRRQVIFFTCHPATVQAFAERAEGCTVLELGG